MEKNNEVVHIHCVFVPPFSQIPENGYLDLNRKRHAYEIDTPKKHSLLDAGEHWQYIFAKF